MSTKRLNIMLYSNSTGEQIILPINPVSINIKYEKKMDKYEVLGFGEVNIMGNPNPIRISLSHFLPEDNSIFGTNSGIMLNYSNSDNYMEYEYSSDRAVEILKRWAFNKRIIRLVIDDELNMEGIVVSFAETIRESTASKPYVLEIVEYKNPTAKIKNLFGLIKRDGIYVPKIILAKANDTIYSLASKYGLDFKKLSKINGILNVNSKIKGKKLTTIGA